jgi:hypothetical protein
MFYYGYKTFQNSLNDLVSSASTFVHSNSITSEGKYITGGECTIGGEYTTGGECATGGECITGGCDRIARESI